MVAACCPISRKDDPAKASPYVRHLCLALYTLHSYSPDAAAKFLESSRAGRGCAAVGIDALKTIIENWFLAVPDDKLASILEPTEPQQKRAVAKARSYYTEYLAGQWVAQENTTKGLTPRTSCCGEKVDELRGDFDPDSTLTRSNMTLVKNRMWATRWRRRHAIALGSIAASAPLTLDEMREKVPYSYSGSLSERSLQHGRPTK